MDGLGGAGLFAAFPLSIHGSFSPIYANHSYGNSLNFQWRGIRISGFKANKTKTSVGSSIYMGFHFESISYKA